MAWVTPSTHSWLNPGTCSRSLSNHSCSCPAYILHIEAAQLIAFCIAFSSPAANDIVWLREIAPYLSYLGPAWFRRLLLHLVPVPSIQRLKNITDVMTKRTEEIYYAKKAAIQSGDKESLHALGEGKDIVSVLCECLAESYVLFLR